jgi:hypothetical protein
MAKKRAARNDVDSDARLRAQQELSRNWSGPKSICMCGHHGDGKPSWHTNTFMPGHGRCFHPDCKGCDKFRWKAFTEPYTKALDSLDRRLSKAAAKRKAQ